jgi:hypothetical protein
MSVHPDKTAIRAVDACGGAYSAEQIASGWAKGHTDALCEAMKAVVDADALTAELFAAAHFAKAASATLEDYEADTGEPLDDMHELGRIDESRGSPSFRIRVGHIRRLAAAIAKATEAA